MNNENYKSPCPCGECKPRNMMGMSWWKNLGFNFPTECAVALREQGHTYISDWACMYCTGNEGVFTHYDKCDQCADKEE
jgi:hypothetical protein